MCPSTIGRLFLGFPGAWYTNFLPSFPRYDRMASLSRRCIWGDLRRGLTSQPGSSIWLSHNSHPWPHASHRPYSLHRAVKTLERPWGWQHQLLYIPWHCEYLVHAGRPLSSASSVLSATNNSSIQMVAAGYSDPGRKAEIPKGAHLLSASTDVWRATQLFYQCYTSWGLWGLPGGSLIRICCVYSQPSIGLYRDGWKSSL